MSSDFYKMTHKPVYESSKNSYKQGYYHPFNIEKYIGNPSLIIYRSSWEFHFCQWCDNSQIVLKWASEPIKIKYYDKVANLKQCHELGLNPNDPSNWKVSNYYVDFMIDIQIGDNTERWLIEVKPSCKLVKPEEPIQKKGKSLTKYNRDLREYIINSEKFKAAQDYADSHGYKFVIFTEHTFKQLGIKLI